MRRGAIFGGRWMGVIVGILCAIGWAFMAGFVFCRWLSIGDEIWYLISWKGLAEGIFMTSLTIAVPTVIAAVFGALIMGIGGGVAYGRHSVKNEQEGRSAEETIQQP
jgi:hypothetical protein